MDQEPRSPDEFETLCREHGDAAVEIVRRKLGRRLRRRLDSQDVVQEAFLVASRLYEAHRQRLARSDDDFRNWLAAIIERRIHKLARHHVEAHRRSLEKEVSLTDSAVANLEDLAARTPSSLAMADERRQAILEALGRLSPRQREVIELVHLQNLALGDAARKMGKTPNATSVLLYRALERLGSILKREDV